jgi:hypothetical protein
MPAPFQCSHCGYSANVKDELRGKKIKCPKCKQPAMVGGDEEPQKVSGDGLMGVNLDSYRDAEGEEELLEAAPKAKSPKKKRKKGKNAPLPGNVKAAAFGFSLLSIVVLAGLAKFVAPAIVENIKENTAESAPAEAPGSAPADGAAKPAAK